MPTYEYQCRTCEARFDAVQSFADAALTLCPQAEEAFSPAECVLPGEGEVKKVFSVPAITFKGDGFYKTDSRKAAGKSSGISKSDDSGAGGDSGTGDDSGASGKAGSDGDSGGDSGSTSADSKNGSGKSASKSGSDSKRTPASV